MTTTPAPTALPTGAVSAEPWSHGTAGSLRWFHSREFPVCMTAGRPELTWLSVRAGGIEIVDARGVRSVVRLVAIHCSSPNGVAVLPEQAAKLTDALMEANRFVAALEAADEID